MKLAAKGLLTELSIILETVLSNRIFSKMEMRSHQQKFEGQI